MATISSLGTGSGLDLSSIISGLVNAERAPVVSRLDRKQVDITTELSAFGALKSSLSLFQSSFSSLSSATAFRNKSIDVGDSSVLSATASSVASPGNYSVEVTSVARAQSLATSETSLFSDIGDTIGTGTLTVKFGTTSTGPYAFSQDTSKATQTIEVSAANGNTTLSGLRDYINAGDYGFSASIINVGSGYRLVLSSDDTGAANSMEISVSGDGDGNNTDNTGLSQLAFNSAAQGSLSQTVAARDTVLLINGVEVTRESSKVTGAINGVTLNIKKEDAGNVFNISVSDDNTSVTTAIQEFVTRYNELIANINNLTAYDAETGESGVLTGDSTVRSVAFRIKNIISSTVPQLDGEVTALANIGITTDYQTGQLTIDNAKLTAALAGYPDQVEALFAMQGRPDDNEIEYVDGSSLTSAGNYAVNISALATQGFYQGSAVNSLTIDADNDEFVIKVDGYTSNTISLAQGSYADADTLAAHIEAQINDDASLKSSGVTVSVSYNSGSNQFEITSSAYGSSSSLEFLSVDTTTASSIGFAVGAGTTGTDVSGTINGLAAVGKGQILTSDSGDSEGLELRIVGGTTGNRGYVSFSRGIGSALNDILDGFLGSGGLISAREDGLNKQLDDILAERDKLEVRISSLEARLVKQFTALDTLIAQFNSTSSYLAQQLANLPKPNSINSK